MQLSFTGVVKPVAGILWHPLGISIVGCNGGETRNKQIGKRYMIILATRSVVAVKRKETLKSKQNSLGGNRWAVSTWIGLRLGSELSS
jgi:hypothetical protein